MQGHCKISCRLSNLMLHRTLCWFLVRLRPLNLTLILISEARMAIVCTLWKSEKISGKMEVSGEAKHVKDQFLLSLKPSISHQILIF